MKLKVLAVLVFVGLIGISAFAGEGLPNTYQVTAPVTAIAPDMITVKAKDGTSWEIAKDAKTKLTGAPKVGDTVKIMYRMSAASIEVLPSKGK